MSQPSNQNIPDSNDRLAGKSSEQEAEKSGDQSLHNRFLQDISSEKHIPDLKQNETKASSVSLLEAIFDATIIRAISLTVNEFRLLGNTLINKSVLLGLSKEFGQSPLLALLKGEIKENFGHLDKSSLQRIVETLKEKRIKDKELQGTKELENKEKVKKNKQDIQTKTDEKDLADQELVFEENKSEIIPNQDRQTELDNQRYNINETIRKATELELSMLLPAEHHKSLGQSLEHATSADLGSKSQLLSQPLLSIERLKHCIEQFSRGKILVLGDLLIDELLEGRPERISREAPVLILEHVDTVLIPGGAGNTAHNVTALGGKCHAVGVCGQDEYADKLKQLLDSLGIEHSLVVDPSRPTTVKTRILSKTHALMQQLLRLDRISHDPITKLIETALINNLNSLSKQYPILILSDYRGGLITDEIIHSCKKLTATQDLMIIVDAQDKFERFQNVTLLTPNQPDTERAVGYRINNEADLLQAGEDMLLLTGAESVLITRGKEGMALFSRGNIPFSLPAFNRSEVYDVSGAGDTVVATIALALTTGATLPEAMALGSIAASIVVKKPGTAVTSQKEILDLLPLIKLPA